jgi:amino acid transporter
VSTGSTPSVPDASWPDQDPPSTGTGTSRASRRQAQPAASGPGLRRVLGLRDLLAYGLVFMVPIAPFGIFGQVFSTAGGMVVLAYALGMVAMWFTALSYAQMVRAFPMAGSVYNYASRGLHPSIGFLAGWIILLDYVLVPGLLALIAAVAMTSFVPGIPAWGWIVIFVAVNTAVNLLGLRLTAAVTRWFLIGELAVLAVFVVVGLWALAAGHGGGWSFAPVFNSANFSWSVLLGGVSLAMLSFLGFDGISMLAEENQGGARQIGQAMIAALALTGVLFAAQTWVASMLVKDPAGLISKGDPGGTAFYDTAGASVGPWLATLTALATALAWGIANSLVAQVATSRLLFAMARDRQLPAVLAAVSRRRAVPIGAVVTSAVISLLLGIWAALRSDGIAVLSTLVTFGAMCAFLILHVSVVWHYLVRNRSGDLVRHLVVPVVGFALLVAVVINANVAAQRLGVVWIGLGIVVLIILSIAGRRPQLAGMNAQTEDAGSSQ